MHKVKIVAVLNLVCSLVASCSTKEEGEFRFKTEYRMQVNVGPQTAWGMGARRFAELARIKTGGRVNIKPYYNSELLRGAQLLSAQMVARGNIDCALESTINISPVVPELNVFALPFFVRSYERLDRLERGTTGALLFDLMRAKGLEPLAWGENGFRQLTNNRRAVRKPEDLRGLRIRVVGSPIFVDVFRALRADPVNMNWGDAITAFQQGTVDGQENPIGILLPVRIYEFHKYMTYWNYACDPLVLYWCRSEWEKFPPDVKQALREAAEEAADWQKCLARVGLDNGEALDRLRTQYAYEPEVKDPLALLTDRGMDIVMLTDQEWEEWRLATAQIRDKWRQELGPEMIRAIHNDLGETP